jgi:hypothetical protein
MLRFSAVIILLALLTTINAAAQHSPSQAPPSDQPPLRGTLAVPERHEPSFAELDKSQAQEWHRVTLQLGGSMCPACLLELEGKLRALAGVSFARVDRGETKEPAQAKNTKPSKKHVSATIIYDKHTVLYERLRDLIKNEYYQISDVVDNEMSK